VLQVTEQVSANACSAHFESDPTSVPAALRWRRRVDHLGAIGDCFATVARAFGHGQVRQTHAPALMNATNAVVFAGGIDYVATNADPTSAS